MKLATVFSSSNSSVHIQVLPDSEDFPTSLSASAINGICSATAANLVSHFHVS